MLCFEKKQHEQIMMKLMFSCFTSWDLHFHWERFTYDHCPIKQPFILVSPVLPRPSPSFFFSLRAICYWHHFSFPDLLHLLDLNIHPLSFGCRDFTSFFFFFQNTDVKVVLSKDSVRLMTPPLKSMSSYCPIFFPDYVFSKRLGRGL